MKELEERLVKVLDKAINLAEQSGEFVIDQAPELLREFYAWNITVCIFCIVLSILMCVAFNEIRKRIGEDEAFEYQYFSTTLKSEKALGRHVKDSFNIWLSFILTALVSLTLFLSSVYHLLYIAISPKLYLINYFVK